ncbi:hypothetical protein BS47DRAFT_1383234 [Hydnum rufescens UP504]|uniref:Protein kinase domain-containing protein n=1 Tax=Hydnum rufescens UP504 TaxID=1448309 RepID=A0A9P6AU36_9AGAM|nr:hypothetical protein BS47DRAFT_1383234 [Hydnum rufescens UP504]
MIIGTLPPSFWSAKDFCDMTHTTPPIRWPISGFYSSTTSSRSSLQPFLTAKVLDVTCFRTAVFHLYLIFRIELQDVEKGSETRLWARCERLAPSGPDASIFTTMRDLGREALDTICISSDSSSLRQKANDNNLRFQRSFKGNLTMLHVVDLLHGLHQNFPQYRLQTHSCWWYAATIISVLDLFGAEFSINIPEYVLFRQNAANCTRKIVRLYSLKWFQGVVPVQEVLGASDVKLEDKEPCSRSSLLPLVLEDTLPEPLCSVVLKSPLPVRRGSYATVFKGTWNSRPIALKLLGPNDKPEIAHKRFKGETDIWRKLRHENVLPFFGHYVGDNGAMYMISPWCQYGDVNNYLLMFPKTDREMLVLQLLHGLEYLHQSGVIHGDLRGANILISDDHEVWIADFGLSKHLDQSPTSTVNRGNVRWMAPELLEQEIPRGDLTPYTEATDIYSFAMTTIEIYTGLPPFPHLRHNVEVGLLCRGRPGRPGADGVSHCIDDKVWGIIQECWVEEPTRRLSARDAKERLEAHRKGKLSIAV